MTMIGDRPLHFLLLLACLAASAGAAEPEARPARPNITLPADLKAAGGSAYYGEMVGVDRSMGTLRAGLRQLGLADDTMLWFSSDNGGWIDPAKPDAHGTNLDLRGRKGDLCEGACACLAHRMARAHQARRDGRAPLL